MDGTRPFYYSPIVETAGVVTGVRPLYYGMLLMYLAGQGPVLDVTVTTSASHFTAYAIDYQADHSLSVVLDNKDPSTGIQATIELGATVANASAIYLTGAEPGSLTTESVRLAGAEVSAAGDWPLLRAE